MIAAQVAEDEDEAEDNLLRPRPRPRTKFRPRGQSGLEDLTSLSGTNAAGIAYNHIVLPASVIWSDCNVLQASFQNNIFVF